MDKCTLTERCCPQASLEHSGWRGPGAFAEDLGQPFIAACTQVGPSAVAAEHGSQPLLLCKAVLL